MQNQPCASRLGDVYETAQDILSLTGDRVSAQDMCSQEEPAAIGRKGTCTGGARCPLTAGMAFAPEESNTALQQCIRRPITKTVMIHSSVSTGEPSLQHNVTCCLLPRRLLRQDVCHSALPAETSLESNMQGE